MINAEVTKTGTENALSTIRKFTRRVQGTGLIKGVRAQRYYSRTPSKIVKKKHALKTLARREEYHQKVKEGKIAEVAPRRAPYNRDASSTPRTTGSTGTPNEGAPIAR